METRGVVKRKVVREKRQKTGKVLYKITKIPDGLKEIIDIVAGRCYYQPKERLRN